MKELKIDSLAYALLQATRAIMYVMEGMGLPSALALVASKENVPVAAQGAVQDISYRTLRQWGRVEIILSFLLKKRPKPAALYSLLACALSLFNLSDDDSIVLPYENYTVVNQAVDLVKTQKAWMHASSMVNAVLRNFLRERLVLIQKAMQTVVGRWNYPAWWVSSLQAIYPHDWEKILNVGNTLPPLILRVNQRKITKVDYLALLQQHQIAAKAVGDVAVQLLQPVGVQSIPGFADGLVSVQDVSAQWAAPLLELKAGMRVLDACAAPGGKTGHILECADVDLWALEVDAGRLAKVQDNLDRLGLSAKLICGDAAKQTWWDGTLFDCVLADVPCTASGIVRRHADIRWLRREEDANNLASVAQKILDNLWQMVRPGGKLLLVTCSIWPAESESQAVWFQKRTCAKRLPAPGQILPGVGNEGDGLFYALFQKESVVR
jgi:16S rRNA (cytosine967-C5)-methyltransferase